MTLLYFYAIAIPPIIKVMIWFPVFSLNLISKCLFSSDMWGNPLKDKYYSIMSPLKILQGLCLSYRIKKPYPQALV